MDLNKKNIQKISGLIVFAAIIFWLGYYLPSIFTIFLFILGIAFPLILGFCIAFVLNVLLRVLETGWDKLFKDNKIAQKMKRICCIMLSLIIILIIIFVLLFMIVPEISRTAVSIAQSFPEYIAALDIKIDAFFENFGITLPHLEKLQIDWSSVANNVVNFINSGSSSFFTTTLNVTTSIFSGLINAFLGFVFAIYMLFSKEKLSNNLYVSCQAFLKEKTVDSLTRITNLSNRVFTNFVTGQLLEAVILGTLCFIGMVVMQMPYALMISSLVCVTSLVPVVGAFFGTGVGAFLILLVSPIQAVWFVIYIIVIQQIDSNFIYPRVVGNAVGLPGIWVLAAITVGASLAGILGMLIAVPIVSVIYVIFKEEVIYRLNNSDGMKKGKLL